MTAATRRLLEEQIAAVVVLRRGEKNDAMWHVPQVWEAEKRLQRIHGDYRESTTTTETAKATEAKATVVAQSNKQQSHY